MHASGERARAARRCVTVASVRLPREIRLLTDCYVWSYDAEVNGHSYRRVPKGTVCRVIMRETAYGVSYLIADAYEDGGRSVVRVGPSAYEVVSAGGAAGGRA